MKREDASPHESAPETKYSGNKISAQGGDCCVEHRHVRNEGRKSPVYLSEPSTMLIKSPLATICSILSTLAIIRNFNLIPSTGLHHWNMAEDVSSHGASTIRRLIATNAVLAMPELLEMIFLKLPLEDIVLAANVCSAWYHVTETSVAIRKNLRACLTWHWYPAEQTPAAQQPEFEHDDCICANFAWGTVIIRRQSDFEAIGVLSAATVSPGWLAIVNGREKTMTISQGHAPWLGNKTSSRGWKLEFCDREADRVYVDWVLHKQYRKHWPLLCYLWYFHAEESSGLRRGFQSDWRVKGRAVVNCVKNLW